MKEQYLRSVGRLLDCPPEQKKALLYRLDRAVTAYLEDEPDAGASGLTANFGAPEECAGRLLEECGPMAVAEEERRRTRRHRVLLAVLAVLTAAALVVSACLYDGWAVTGHGDDVPDYIKNSPKNQVTYHYDD